MGLPLRLGLETLGVGGAPPDLGGKSPLGRRLPLRWDLQGPVPFPIQPMGPSGIGGPTRWTPGTLPVVPVQYRVTPKLSRWPKQHFLYSFLYLRTFLELLVTSGISFGTPNNIRFAAYSYSYNPSVTEP